MNNNKFNRTLNLTGILLSTEDEDRRSYKWYKDQTSGRSVWFCEICGFRFESYPYLKSHYRNKHGEDFESYNPWLDGRLDVNCEPPLPPKSKFQDELKAAAAKIKAAKLRAAEAELRAAEAALNAANNNNDALNNNN